ncbi:MAG TPA: hypothetical protein VHT03_10935 [Rhizomicrobium sp.]|nr:hypothetical protein [Rhizomicrobium sp.]
MADTNPTELTFGADGLFAADLSDGLAAAIALIGTAIALAIWFGWPILVHGAAVLPSVLSAL